MSEMDSLIEQTIADFDDIELAMEELGVDVPFGTDTSQYGNLIRANFVTVDQEYNPESEKAQSGKAVAEALASQPIKYLESLDSENYRNLYDLESGMYVLYGNFLVYPNATKGFVFSKKLFVAVSHGTISTCVQVLYPAYNTLQYLNIYPDETSETGYSYERKDAQLYYMEDTRNKVTALDETVTDEHYPSAKAVYSALPTELSQLSEDATHRTVTDAEKTAWNAKSEFSGAYADLTGKPTIPTVPTNVGAFTNDVGYAKSTEVSTEKSRAESAESALGTRITEETNRATEAEGKISQNLASHIATYNEKVSSLEVKDQSLTETLDTFMERVNTILESDDVDLDRVQEMVDYMKNNKDLIDAITISKVNISDIIDNLLSTATNKPLSANQGRVLKALIDALTTNFADHKTAYEAKLVELTNADSANNTAIANEVTRAKAAEKANADAITEIKNAGYVTDTELENKDYAKATEIPTELSDLNEDATHRTVTDTEKANWNAKSDFSGSYNDLKDKPTIPAAVTVDNALSDTSTNPVQNKVINEALGSKITSNGWSTEADGILIGDSSDGNIRIDPAGIRYTGRSTGYPTGSLTYPDKSGTIAVTDDIPFSGDGSLLSEDGTTTKTGYSNLFSGSLGLSNTNTPTPEWFGSYKVYITFIDQSSGTSVTTGESHFLSEFTATKLGTCAYRLTLPHSVCNAEVLVVYDYDTFGRTYGGNLIANGIYLGYKYDDITNVNGDMCTNSSDVSTIYQYNIKKLPNRYLDLEGHDLIKSLLARIKALEAKI